MSHTLYVASPVGHAGKSMVAFALVDVLARRVGRVGVYRPVVADRDRDSVMSLLTSHDGVVTPYDEGLGVSYEELHADPEAALARIVHEHRRIAETCDVVVAVGSDFTDIASPTEFATNARIAANLGAATILVVPMGGQTAAETGQVAEIAAAEIAAAHAHLAAVVANRCPTSADLTEVSTTIRGRLDVAAPVWTVPEIPLLAAPSVRQVMERINGELLFGDPALTGREAEHMLVAGMAVEHVLERLLDGQLVIAAGDRPEVLIALLAAHASASYPSLAGVVLNGGFRPSAAVTQLVTGLDAQLPVVTTELGTYDTAVAVAATRGVISAGAQRKRDLTLATMGRHLPDDEVLGLVAVSGPTTVTPLMFEATLADRARQVRRRVVLPEGDDDRILRAASTVLARGVADLTILGQERTIRSRAAELGLDLGDATVIDPTTSPWLDEFTNRYAEARAHKGMTPERAREVVHDVSYFGTLMVDSGRADGMVSGAVHTTAHTIRPALEVIRTAPGTAIVSSVFLMCLADEVLVYGDCAVNPDPDAENLADIAISSAGTAVQFGIEPRVALLSYSTGESGSGSEVDKVRTATALVRQRRPDLLVEGPIQYDAAVEESVARTKLPDSPVAGRATVLVFPDLNTGNNTYKAVQRSAGAVAIGPVLQGLAKPVNDLSRGATVNDIVNTIAITAIQAADRPGGIR